MNTMKSRLSVLLLALSILPGLFAADSPTPERRPPMTANPSEIFFHEGGASLPAYPVVARNETPSGREVRMKWFHERASAFSFSGGFTQFPPVANGI